MSIAVARLAGAFGIKGEMRVVSLTQNAPSVFALGVFHDSAGQEYKVVRYRPLKEPHYAVCFAHITSRNVAEQCPKGALYVHRNQLPHLNNTPDDDDFYYTDLIGLTVHTPDQQHVGVVHQVCNFGAGDLLVVLTHNKTEVFFPFTKQAVPFVRVTEGCVVVCAQAWHDLTSKTDEEPSVDDSGPQT